MPLYSDLKSLYKAFDDVIDDTLRSNVAPVVERILQHHINESVYKAYTPVSMDDGSYFDGYTRRYELLHTFTSTAKKGLLIVSPTAEEDHEVQKKYGLDGSSFSTPIDPEASRLMQWIEFGCVPNVFTGAESGAWNRPRPAVANAQREAEAALQPNGKIFAALRTGLAKRLGYNTEFAKL